MLSSVGHNIIHSCGWDGGCIFYFFIFLNVDWGHALGSRIGVTHWGMLSAMICSRLVAHKSGNNMPTATVSQALGDFVILAAAGAAFAASTWPTKLPKNWTFCTWKNIKNENEHENEQRVWNVFCWKAWLCLQKKNKPKNKPKTKKTTKIVERKRALNFTKFH